MCYFYRRIPGFLKKLFAILLLMLVFFNQVTYYFVYSIQQYYVRVAVKKQLLATIPEAALEHIEDNAQIIWEEEGKEFYYKGQLFDVVSVKEVNGKITYLCLEDEKETKLLKSLARAARARTDQQGKGKKSAYPHLSFDCVLINNDRYQASNFINQPLFVDRNSRLLTSSIEVKGPPPKA